MDGHESTPHAGAGTTAGDGGARSPRRLWRLLGSFAVGLVLAFGGFWGYYGVKGCLYEPRPRTVKAARPELGVIRLEPARSKQGVPGWVATFHVDVPVAQGWRVLSDCTRYPQVLKGVSACRRLEQGPGWAIHRMEMHHPPGAWMRIRTTYHPAQHTTRWIQVKGSFRAGAGYTRLRAVDGQPGWTQVTLAYFLDISAVLPESFQRPRVRRLVRRMAREVQRYFGGSPPGPPRPR